MHAYYLEPATADLVVHEALERGVPAISLPLLQGEDGMPMGAQLVGRKGHDARLLGVARWLVERERRHGGSTGGSPQGGGA
mgnify:CR=1 FL=1